MTIRALTLTQPWATLVAIGAKRIETRSWTTSYRGPLVIHAAAGLAPIGGMAGLVRLVEGFWQTLAPDVGGYTPEEMAELLPRGALVAAGALVDVVRTGEAWSVEVDERERAFGDFSPGRYAWLLGRHRWGGEMLRIGEPIPTRGALGLWTLRDADALAELGELWTMDDPDAWYEVGRRALSEGLFP